MKLLSTILKERTETIEFRALRKRLMNAAQNEKAELRTLNIKPPTIIMLQNHGIKVEKVKEHSYEVYILSW